MNDFEGTVATLVNERVDARLGPRRSAPPLDPERRPTRPRRRLVLPLAVAAGVAVLIGAAVIAGRALDHRDHTAPAPGSTHSGTVVRLGAADVYLPPGWVARDIARYQPEGGSSVFPGWCLTPRSVPVSTAPDACPVSLLAVQVKGNPLDVDLQGGLAANPAPCGQRDFTTDESSREGRFGGRSAEWRNWVMHCATGRTVRIQQYVVPTRPGYILYTGRATAPTRAAMAEIAARSRLPRQSAPLRLMDRGVVSAVQRGPHQVIVSLHRVVRSQSRTAPAAPGVVRYVVPRSVFDAGAFNGAIKAGVRVYLATDGYRVTQIYRD